MKFRDLWIAFAVVYALCQLWWFMGTCLVIALFFHIVDIIPDKPQETREVNPDHVSILGCTCGPDSSCKCFTCREKEYRI